MSDLYTTPQAAKYLHRSKSGIRLYVKKGYLVGFKPHSNLRLFTQQELDKFAEKWPVTNVPEHEQIIREVEDSSIKEVAKKYNVNVKTIYRRLKNV